LRKSLYAPLFALLVATAPAAGLAAEQAPLQVCFTPGGDCTDLVVGEIAAARHQILVQAYSFTSVPILSALRAAHARGVEVEVIVDKTSAGVSKSGSHYSAAIYLTNAGIPVWVDSKVAIAHNKVMIVDGAVVITGSFNFTAAAQDRNAENLLVISDPAVAALYRDNWRRRQAVSFRFGRAVEGQSG
jgi:phosphatidylserine/phosphatidylglycerophosphate/cardiolipin synthase-like enzyme